MEKVIRYFVIILSLVLFVFACLSVAGKVYLLKAETAGKYDELDNMAKYYQQALAIFPFDQKVWLAASEGLTEKKMKILKDFTDKALVYNREDSEIFELLAENAQKLGNFDLAQKYYHDTKYYNPQKPMTYIELAKIFREKDDIHSSFKYLFGATQILMLGNTLDYSQMQNLNVSKIKLQFDVLDLQKSNTKYIEQIDVTRTPFLDRQLAKTYYFLGLDAYQSGQPELTMPFWQVATYLAPEWSYFHLELANLFLSSGAAEKARTQLRFCMQFYHPKTFCQQFVDEYLLENRFESIGFLESEVQQNIH